MDVLLQSDPTTVGLVNASIIVLVVIFLTLPTVFVLAEYLRNRRAKNTPMNPGPITVSVAAPEPSAPSQVVPFLIPTATPVAALTAMPAPPLAPTVPLDTVSVLATLDSHTVDHDFTREAVPPLIGYVGHGRRHDGDLAYAGHLQLAPQSVVTGGIDTTGSLALGDGAYVMGPVEVGGNMYLRRGARIEGRAHVGGNAFLAAWSQLHEIVCDGVVELEEGAVVDNLLDAAQAVHVDRVHEPRLKHAAPQDPGGVVQLREPRRT